jgi:hypothetical protein
LLLLLVRRERCGGQGYLSVNRFGELIGFAHAGMTAEGDNRWVHSLFGHSICSKHRHSKGGFVCAEDQPTF